MLQQVCRLQRSSPSSEYWWWALFSFLVYFIPSLAFVGSLTADGTAATGVISLLWGLAVLALLLPSLAVFVRRMHDTGRSGWWWFLGFIPLVGPIVLLVFLAQAGDPGPNRYGDPPA